MEGVYLTCVPILGAIVVVVLLLVHFDSHPTAKPILVCALGGITGSWIYAVKVYVAAVTGGRWKEDQVVERLTSPFEGIFLSVSTYAMIRSGLLGVSVTKDGVDPLYSSYAIGFFVGLFSVQVMGRLAGISKTLFGSTS